MKNVYSPISFIITAKSCLPQFLLISITIISAFYICKQILDDRLLGVNCFFFLCAFSTGPVAVPTWHITFCILKCYVLHSYQDKVDVLCQVMSQCLREKESTKDTRRAHCSKFQINEPGNQILPCNNNSKDWYFQMC